MNVCHNPWPNNDFDKTSYINQNYIPKTFCVGSVGQYRWVSFVIEFFQQGFGAVFVSKGYPFKNIFDFTTAGDWDCVAAVERLPALHYSVNFIFLSFGIIGFIVELWNN